MDNGNSYNIDDEEDYKELAEKQYYFSRKLKKNHGTLQLVVSVILIIICCCCSLINNNNNNNVYYLSRYFRFSFFTRTLQRKYMFLLCNGILAFLIAKNSLLSACTTSTSFMANNDVNESLLLENAAAAAASTGTGGQGQQQEEETELSSSSSSLAAAAEEEEVNPSPSEKQILIEDHAAGEGTHQLVSIPQDEDEESVIGGGADDDDDQKEKIMAEEAKADDVPNEPTTDELNKKFEEFIRKMKEELRIEAQQQHLIVV